jgi:hypothetical protein
MNSDEFRDLRPGLKVDIVVTTDYIKEITDVRRAVIYETEHNKIILSQTNPPLTRFYLNRGMAITYLAKTAGGLMRRGGVFGKMTDLISYRLASSEKVHAITMMLKSGAELQNLRMHFRVRPSSDQNLLIYLREERFNIIDISIGGALLCHGEANPIKPHTRLQFSIIIDGEKFDTEADVLRAWSPYMGKKQEVEYVSIKFLKMDKRLNYLLGGKIFNIQREDS